MRILHDMPYEAAAPRLAAMGAPEGAALWDSVKGNLTLFDDVKDILHLINGPVLPVIEVDDADYIAAALEALPGDLTEKLVGMDAKKESTGRRGRFVMPLRQRDWPSAWP